MPRDDELTPEQAEEILERPAKREGRGYRGRVPAGPPAATDVPSEAQRNDPPGWARDGGKRTPRPDD